jgi:hypothetical protein
MNMNTQLQVKENVSLALPGIDLTDNSLTVLRDLTPDETRLALQTLRTVDDASRFWIGDMLRHVKQAHKKKALEQHDEVEANKIGDAAAREAAGQFADKMAAWEAMCVTELLGGKRHKISYKHHREALAECGSSVNEAMKWMDRARDNNWSVREMRQEIRRAKNPRMISQDTHGTPTLTGAVAKLNRQLVGMFRILPLDDMDFDDVACLLDELKPIDAQIDLLKSRLGKIKSAQISIDR